MTLEEALEKIEHLEGLIAIKDDIIATQKRTIEVQEGTVKILQDALDKSIEHIKALR